MKRCIICKKEIIEFGEKHFTGFQSIFPPKEFDKACYFVLRDGRAARITHLHSEVKWAASGICV